MPGYAVACRYRLMMPVITITDPSDPRIADYQTISDPELVRRRGLFVAEGRVVVRRLLAQTRFAVKSVLVTPAALVTIDEGTLRRADVPVYLADAAVLAAAAGFTFHRGCLAMGVRRPADADLKVVDPGRHRLVVVLEALAQADNVGSVFRNAAAFGADLVMLGPGCCDPLYRKALRTSIGTVLVVPFVRRDDWPGALDELRGAGFRLMALTPQLGARPIDQLPGRSDTDRVALLVGAEGAGLSPAALAMADERVRIPMAAGVDSLNVATATGIALHRLTAALG